MSAEQIQGLSAINPLADDPSYGFLPGRDIGQISIAGFATNPGGPGAEGDYLFHYTSYQADNSFRSYERKSLDPCRGGSGADSGQYAWSGKQ